MFFNTGGGEAVESAWKLAKQYLKESGRPLKYKVSTATSMNPSAVRSRPRS